jgi:hypothetical protein
MADEKIVYPEDEPEDSGEKQYDPNQYQDIRKTAVPPREVDVVDSGGHGKSYSASLEDTSKLTDIQATFRALLPSYSIKEIDMIAHAVMMARIFPQKYRHLYNMLVVSIMRENPELVPRTVMILVDSMLSIGYDGKARVEVVEVAGVMGEDELSSMSTGVFDGR